MGTRASLVSIPIAASLLVAPLAPCAAADPECGAPATAIHAIQGAGASSPLAGSVAVVEGVIVGDFPDYPDGLGGFFVQEEDVDADADPLTSEGLFVFAPDFGDVQAGDTLRARGEVREFFGLTELGRVEWAVRCPARGSASAAAVALPLADPDDWERVEGMRVRIEQPLVASGAEELGHFGEVVLGAGERLFAPTQRATPGDPARAWHERNLRHRVLLDDGRHVRWPDPTPYLATAQGRALRLGDRLERLEGVVDFAFGSFRIHPTLPVRLESAAARPVPTHAPRGALRVAAWNVENFFNGDGAGGGFPTRGAASARELGRQRAKLVALLAAVDADVLALVELENDGAASGSAARELASALSDRIGAPIEVVDPGAHALGEQEIAVGILYRSDRVAPLGPPAVLDVRADPAFDSERNRPSLAQTVVHRATGERVTIALNHWKSKGSSCDRAGDPDLGDGQGECNRTRTRAATALAQWLSGDPTHAGATPALVVGDLNSYPNEDPLHALTAAGFVDLLARFAGPDTYSYVFDGAAGRLDHALASTELARFVSAASVWHANSDEPPLFDYRLDNPPDAFAPDPYRASDHDPVLVDLFRDGDADGRADARDACPETTTSPTILWGTCDTRVPERIDPTGCGLGDRLREFATDARTRRTLVSRLGRWVVDRFADGALSPREAVAILACARSRA